MLRKDLNHSKVFVESDVGWIGQAWDLTAPFSIRTPVPSRATSHNTDPMRLKTLCIPICQWCWRTGLLITMFEGPKETPEGMSYNFYTKPVGWTSWTVHTKAVCVELRIIKESRGWFEWLWWFGSVVLILSPFSKDCPWGLRFQTTAGVSCGCCITGWSASGQRYFDPVQVEPE